MLATGKYYSLFHQLWWSVTLMEGKVYSVTSVRKLRYAVILFAKFSLSIVHCCAELPTNLSYAKVETVLANLWIGCSKEDVLIWHIFAIRYHDLSCLRTLRNIKKAFLGFTCNFLPFSEFQFSKMFKILLVNILKLRHGKSVLLCYCRRS